MKMKISYKKNFDKSYMVLQPDRRLPEDSYCIKLLENTSAPALLHLTLEHMNDSDNLLYDISGKQSFSKAFENEKMTYNDFLALLDSLDILSLTLSDYLLQSDNLLINEDTIFLSHTRKSYYFCYLPARQESLQIQLRGLFNNILSLIDYEDKRLSTLAFSLNTVVQNDNFTISDLACVFMENDLPDTPDRLNSPPVFTGQTEETDEDFSREPVYKERKSAPSFLQKARFYFNDHRFDEIFDDINSAKIFKHIRETVIPQPALPLDTDIYDDNYEFTPDPVVFRDDIRYGEQESDPGDNISDTSSLNIEAVTWHTLSGTGLASGIIIHLQSLPFFIGSRENGLNYSLLHPTISRTHCKIYEDPGSPGQLLVQDLNSKNGTFVNDTPLSPYGTLVLKSGDTLQLADLSFIFV